MAQQIELPDYLKDMVDDGGKDLITSGGGHPRISIRGRQFRFIVEGEEESKQTDPINMIILGVVPEAGMAKTWYESGYQPGSTDPPDCSSFFGVKPDNWVDKPQSDNCATCAQNKWGSAKSMTGKKAKACKDSKRLMVIKAEDLKEDSPTVYVFNTTVASLKALSEFGKFLLTNKLPMAAIITEIAFVDSEFPQVEFNFKAVLKEEMGTKSLEMANQKVWLEGQDVIEAPPAKAQPKIEAPQTTGAADPTAGAVDNTTADQALEDWG